MQPDLLSHTDAVILANSEGGFGMQAAVEKLMQSRPVLDAVEAGIQVVERDPRSRSVGLGGAPNLLGEMECDAAVMCGTTLRTGAVGALQGYQHPVSVARQVLEQSPHVLLVGAGAARFAAEVGAEQANLLDEAARAEYERWLKTRLSSDALAAWPNVPLNPLIRLPTMPSDTTVFLIRDSQGRMAGGTSTSGWAYKYPGRLGDSPIIGAGLYVDDRYGGAACTHTGEMTIRAGTARVVVAYMKKGATVQAACHEAVDDLRALKDGILGPVVIHALDAEGMPYVLSTGNDNGVHYWLWTSAARAIDQHQPVIERL